MLVKIFHIVKNIFSKKRKNEFEFKPAYINVETGELMFTGNIIKRNGRIKYNTTGKIVGLDTYSIEYPNSTSSIITYSVDFSKQDDKTKI